MLALIFAICLQAWNWNNPPAGVELRPDDPQGNNLDAMVKCANASPGGGCAVRFTPGTYYIKKTIVLPSGVVKANFTEVHLVLCADLQQLVSTSSIGPYHSAKIEGLINYDFSKPCGTFRPPTSEWFKLVRVQ